MEKHSKRINAIIINTYLAKSKVKLGKGKNVWETDAARSDFEKFFSRYGRKAEMKKQLTAFLNKGSAKVIRKIMVKNVFDVLLKKQKKKEDL